MSHGPLGCRRTTTRRPVAKRMPLTYRSIGSSAWRSSSTTAPAGSADELAERHPRCGRARPTRAPGSARSDVVEAAARARPSSAGRLVAERTRRRARRARCVMRTTNAFGTSCTSRHGSPQTVNAPDVACGVRRRRPSSASSARRQDLRLGRARSRPRCRARRRRARRRRPSSGSSPRRRRTARARTARSPRSSGGSIAHHRGGQRRARPSSVMTNTLPPVTPST